MVGIDTDIGKLVKAIVHQPGAEIFRVISLASGDHPILCQDLIGSLAHAEHRQFVDVLESEGVEVLYLADLLGDAISNAKADRVFDLWLYEHFPQVQTQLTSFIDSINAYSLIGGDALFYQTVHGSLSFSPLFLPLKWLFYVRDFAAMTPRGLVLANFASRDRYLEGVVGKFVFSWASRLQDYRVVFDATENDLFLQGGDVIVLDGDTLLVGIDNLTERKAAQALSRNLEINVVGVTLPPSNCRPSQGSIYDDWTNLHLLFLHLDSVLNIVHRDKVLAIPYILEGPSKDVNPIQRILRGIRHGIGESSYARLVQAVEQTGWVVEFEAGTGREQEMGCKILDYLRDRGFEVIYVGGQSSTMAEMEHFIEHVWRELRFQAANVLALRPGRVILVEGNEGTQQSLVCHGVETITASARDLVRWAGGPHCMVMPIERQSL